MSGPLAAVARSSVALMLVTSSLGGQQIVDSTFSPQLRAARSFPAGRGPLVAIDEAHNNFHTASGRYRPFVRLLEADGFVVRSSSARFDSASLASVRVLVIANAVAERNKAQSDWRLPVYSAFDAAEIATLALWVRRGGSVLLIADHMPMAGAADSLANALGVYFANGFALPPPYAADPRTGDSPIVFRRGPGARQSIVNGRQYTGIVPGGHLAAHPIIDGRSATERVDSVVSFTGSAFRLSDAAVGKSELMRLPAGTRVRLPVVAWQFSDTTPEIRGDGMLQGAAFRLGGGRVAVFGEAAMFSAQVKGPERVPMGMNAPEAHQNAQFVLNTLHWLVGLFPDR